MSAELKVVCFVVENEVKDVGIEMSKAMGYRYWVMVEYRLESGDSVQSIATGKTKPKLKQRVESIQNNVALGCVAAQQYQGDSGPYWSIVTKCYIGPR